MSAPFRWVVAMAFGAAFVMVVVQMDEAAERKKRRAAEFERERAGHDARAAAGPFIASRKMVDPRIEIVRIAVPDPALSDPLFDTTCLLVRDLELRSITLSCLTPE